MKHLDKVLNIRRNIRLKSGKPERAFINRLKHPMTILRTVEKSCSNAAIFEARRHYLVVLSAAFEMFWRDLIKSIIDDNKISFNSNNKLRNVVFSLQEVQQIAENRFSLGELVVTAYTFQSPETVNQVLSMILDVDVFTLFRKEKYKYIRKTKIHKKDNFPKEIIVSGESILKAIPAINKCFEVRHDTVHDTGNRHRISKLRLFQIDNAMQRFIMFLGPYVYELAENKGRKHFASNKIKS